MYKIIGADQKEYGPVSADQLRQWLGQFQPSPASIIAARRPTADQT